MTQFDQNGQVVWGNQQNAGRDINNIFPRVPWKPPLMLPPPAQSFVGRDEDLAWLLQRLTTGEAGVTLALCGPGGMGKTALAAEALRRLTAQKEWLVYFPDGLFYHSFYTYPSLAVAFEELARVFEEDPSGDPHRAARRAMSRRRALLVFDGVESLDDVRPLRELGGKNVVLVLSRRRADAPDQAHRRDLGLLPQVLAITLLQDLAGPRAADRQSVERLVEQIGGYPLALQLIGSYLSSRQEEVGDYLKWFEHEGLATINFGEHPAQSVQVLLQRTYTSLTPIEQHVVLVLGLLAPAPFPLELVQAILEFPEQAIRQALGSLVNLSLLRRLNLDYEVSHPLIHTFATEHLSSQVHATSSDTITAWRERFLATLATHFDHSNPYDRIDLALRQPHVSPLLAAEYLTAEQSLRTAHLFNAIGFIDFTQGRYAEAEPLLKLALSIREKQSGPTHPDTVTSLTNLGRLYDEQGKYAQAELPLIRSLAVRERHLGPEHLSTAQSLNNLATLYYKQGKYAQAEPLLLRSLMIFDQQLGLEDLFAVHSLNNLGHIYHNQGDYAHAEPLLKLALSVREKQLGPMHPLTAISLTNLAVLYDEQGKHAKAKPLLKRALAICEQALGSTHPLTATSLNNLGIHYAEQRKRAKAEPLLRRALAIREQQLGPTHPDTATSLSNLAELYTSQRKYAEAERLLLRALAIFEQWSGPTHPDTATSLSNLAGLYTSQRKYAEAEPLLRRALAIFEQQLGSTHPKTQTAHKRYTFLLQTMKRKKKRTGWKRVIVLFER